MLVGFILVALAVILFLVICRRCRNMVSPHEHHIKDKGKTIILDAKAAMKKGLNIIKDNSIIAWNESLVLVLSLRDKLHMFREIDNLDVLATIHVDTDLEQEQNNAAIETTLLLVHGLCQNKDITQQTEEHIVSKFKSQLKELDKRQEAECKKQLEVLYTDISAKNKEKLAELLSRHRQQKAKALIFTKDLPEKERDSLMHMIETQQSMEENELMFALALEQNEGAEKLRKEQAIGKRMGIKELLQGLIQDTVSQGHLQEEQADWLVKEHKKQQEAVHRMYDEEISRQRMVLEEKLARRRALAKAAEEQEDDCKETLNLNANHFVGYLQKGKKQNMLSAEQAEEWIDEMKTKSLDIKAEMEAARRAQEEELHKKLSQNKISQLMETMKRQGAEVEEYINKSKAQQTKGPIDPVSYAEGLLKIKSQHREEIGNLENQLDKEHAHLLAEMIDATAQTASEQMKMVEKELQGKLKEKGMTDKMIAILIKKHEAETEDLKQKQARNRQNQEIKLKEELARHQREWAARREKEQQEQEDLREHEADVMEKLVASQMSISEDERNRIMKEHEKQMVFLENSLTLNKLRQQRALEERLSQRRAQQMSKLQTQQQSELKKLQKTAENNGEEDSEDTQRATLELMKRQTQQRIAIIQGQQLNVDDELKQIRIEMMQERALALRSQEERLGAMISALQMEKAREVTKIEEQQKAINNLKANLMDDLSDRGILTISQCEKILQDHRNVQEQVNKKLDRQRQKQEDKVKEKLQERLAQHENILLAQHEAEMSRLMSGTNKMAAKVRQAMLMHKHMLEKEKFRNRRNREMTQVVEETRRKFEINKLENMQEQELAFIAGLVQLGAFHQNELLDVLHMLFPTKTEEAIQTLLARITEGLQNTEKQNVSNNQSSSLVERVHNSKLASAAAFSSRLSLRSAGGSVNMKSKSISKTASSINPQPDAYRDSKIQASTFNYNGNYLSEHEDYSTDYIGLGVSMSHDINPAPAGKLPPLDQEQPKKKKKKFLKRHAAAHEVDDDVSF
ncbi:calponin homology domain-containing protein DDB_G0272472-like isoform X2 [Pomacea canaliculata]|nr:calponin homology domain-containing protein DDB_G0272472-like isoform X2 [Pomacea canaliculata]